MLFPSHDQGGGIYGNQITNAMYGWSCYTPVLRQCSIDTNGDVFSLNSFNPDIPSQQHPNLGSYIPICRVYPDGCITKMGVSIGFSSADGPQSEKLYQIGDCFSWSNNEKIECIVGFSDILSSTKLPRVDYTNEAEITDGQYDLTYITIISTTINCGSSPNCSRTI